MKLYALFYVDEAGVKNLYAVLKTLNGAKKELKALVSADNFLDEIFYSENYINNLTEEIIETFGYYMYSYNNRRYIIEEVNYYDE